MKPVKLRRSFYNRPTLEVAPDLLGKVLVYHSDKGMLSARIVEVEAYIGQDDPACHAARGLTNRNKPMFGPPGFTYIYFVYGMYHCLNVVTESEGSPAAVLIRAAEPVDGLDVMLSNSFKKSNKNLLSGPGRLCRAFGLSREQNDLDLTRDAIYIENRNMKVTNIQRSARIGIKVGCELLWRFYDADSTEVSNSR